MMNHSKILVFIFVLFSLALNAQEVSNVGFEQAGKNINIFYNLNGNGYYLVKIYCNNGDLINWGEALQSVTGDVGMAVKPGINNKIVWDVKQDREELIGDIKFKVTIESVDAKTLYEIGEFEAAGIMFREAFNKDTWNKKKLTYLLSCDMNLMDYDQLIKDCENALKYHPNEQSIYYTAALGAFEQNDFIKAQYLLEKGKGFVKNDNEMLDYLFFLGDTYYQLAKYEESYSLYDEALNINPEDIDVLNDYSYNLALQSVHLTKAKKMAKKAISLSPNDWKILDTYAWVLYKREEFQEAKKWILESFANGGKDAGLVLEHYGDILYKLGQVEEAIEMWILAKEKKGYSELLEQKLIHGDLVE